MPYPARMITPETRLACGCVGARDCVVACQRTDGSWEPINALAVDVSAGTAWAFQVRGDRLVQTRPVFRTGVQVWCRHGEQVGSPRDPPAWLRGDVREPVELAPARAK